MLAKRLFFCAFKLNPTLPINIENCWKNIMFPSTLNLNTLEEIKLMSTIY